MEKNKKYSFVRICSVLMNLMTGALALIAAIIGYSFTFDAGYSTRMGVFLWFLGLLAVFFPNVSFYLVFEFRKKDVVLFQILPMIIGAIFYFFIHKAIL